MMDTTPPGYKEHLTALVPLQRLGRPTDIANAAMFLPATIPASSPVANY
jgi:NAD(P)-dependent dehydrogenase (short-subunit alcohol dehydrogenase family)